MELQTHQTGIRSKGTVVKSEIKNAWSFTFTPLNIFMVWCLGTGTNLSLALHMLLESIT